MNCVRNNRQCCLSGGEFLAERNCDSADRKVYNCNVDRHVVKHLHIVKHRHDIVNEYDVVHEHDYYYHDVVKTREIVKHHDHVPYNPDYCGDNCGENGGDIEFASYEGERNCEN